MKFQRSRIERCDCVKDPCVKDAPEIHAQSAVRHLLSLRAEPCAKPERGSERSRMAQLQAARVGFRAPRRRFTVGAVSRPCRLEAARHWPEPDRPRFGRAPGGGGRSGRWGSAEKLCLGPAARPARSSGRSRFDNRPANSSFGGRSPRDHVRDYRQSRRHEPPLDLVRCFGD